MVLISAMFVGRHTGRPTESSTLPCSPCNRRPVAEAFANSNSAVIPDTDVHWDVPGTCAVRADEPNAFALQLLTCLRVFVFNLLCASHVRSTQKVPVSIDCSTPGLALVPPLSDAMRINGDDNSMTRVVTG